MARTPPGTTPPGTTPWGTLIAAPSGPLRGRAAVPGDKSISHRALIFGALAVGETRITGLLEGEDVHGTALALRTLGVDVERTGPGDWRVWGVGVGGLAEPDEVLDFGNSGTGVRLMMGLLAGQPFVSLLTGDASLRRRPMARVTAPLAQMGAQFIGRSGHRLPLSVVGTDDLVPIAYTSPVASAQVKSAVLLAGLHAPGTTSVVEPSPTRDHTERMLRHFGAEITVDSGASDGPRTIHLTGQPELSARPVAVPADPSSAAFPAVAALIVAGSAVTLPGISTNPLRTGLYATLAEMGAALSWSAPRQEAGEPVADLTIAAGPLRGIEVPAERAPTMIDEYPILAIAAACATGTTVMHGVGELRVKESDRIAAMARGLAACGVAVEEQPDTLIVHGRGAPPPGGATVATELDHRIAMSFLVLGLASGRAVTVDDARPIETSFPGFADLMRGLGADLQVADQQVTETATRGTIASQEAP